MSYLLKSATLVTFDPHAVERADLRIESGRIVERGFELEAREGEETIDLDGKLIMPGLVCAHDHLYSALARGMPAPPRSPGSFPEILELIWWRLDRALDHEMIRWSARLGALEALEAGTTAIIDHHASPSAIEGSLDAIAEACAEVGVRVS